jgi:putative transposase
LDHDEAKQIVFDLLRDQLRKQQGRCKGFVIMPDHVHAVVWFPQSYQVSYFMKQWKQRTSFQIKRFLRTVLSRFADSLDPRDPIWQSGYYDFNIYSERKLLEKLLYMHSNPVKAGLASCPGDWKFSSAGFYETTPPLQPAFDLDVL